MFYYISKIMQVIPASFMHGLLVLILIGLVHMVQYLSMMALYADTDMSFSDNLKRVDLVKIATIDPDVLNRLNGQDIQILLKKPSVARDEVVASAWSYHGETCALDIYFENTAAMPDYIEFRALSLNHDVQNKYTDVDEQSFRLQCMKDVLQAQGVNIPSSVAKRPTPSWDNPYRS